MADVESFVLDGLALNDATFGLIEAQLPVPRQRQDWIGAADSEVQRLVRDPLHDNRTITLKLAVAEQASMDLAHDKLLLVLDKLQKASKYEAGIELDWTPATGTRTATFNVLSGEIVDLPVNWEDGWLAKSPSFTVELKCEPYWLGAEVTTGTAAGSAVFVSMEIPSVPGDVPALGRLIVTDTASQNRRHVEWGLEGPLTYNASTSLLIDSDNLVTSGFAGIQSTWSGAYDPNSSGNSVVNVASLISGQAVAVCGTGSLSHVGTFRVKARVLASVSTQVRLSYRVGDGPSIANSWATVPIEATWVEMDLGTITVPTVLAGTQRWTGTIEALHPSSLAGINIDYLVLVPTSCGYGKARAVYSYSPGVVAAYDQFTSTTATSALHGRTAPAGGSWATSGDTTDFAFADTFGGGITGESINRAVMSAETTGRYAILGSTNYADTQIDMRLRKFSTSNGSESALIARWADANNHLRFLVESGGAMSLVEVVSGTPTTIATATTSLIAQVGVIYRMRIIVFPSGRTIGQLMNDGGTVLGEVQAVSSTLATGGTLATGKPGIRDRALGATAGNRYYDEIVVATPPAEPIALYSGRQLQVRHDDVIRQDSTGTYAGRPRSYRGSRFMLPIGTSRVLVKARRNDIDVATDANVTDSLQIQVAYTPRGLAVPR